MYDATRIRERSALVQVAIDARAQFYPEQRRFSYSHFVGEEEDYRYSPEMYERVVRDYNLKDLSI